MNTDIYSHIATLLLEVEKSLRELDLWSAEMPSPEAMASTEPFAVDKMEFHQWLQFIFVPKLGQLIEMGAKLPANCSIAPMAQEYFKQANYQVVQLIKHLTEIDRLLSSD